MANTSGGNVQPTQSSDLASQLNDLKQLTEQLNNLSESMQQAASTVGSLPDDPPPYYSNA